MLLRNASGFAEVIDFREMAPAAADQNMFVQVGARPRLCWILRNVAM
jgi:gamma-glutamyltranspeptidase